MSERKRLVVGVSGASGVCMASTILQVLKGDTAWESHLVISKGARRTIELEMEESFGYLESLASVVHDIEEIGASIASGSYRTEGMVVIPCSMKTVAGIAHGFSDNLLLRAADVTLKEQRPLVLVARETPLSPIHLQNMASLAVLGVRIMPPMMTFYNKPKTIEDMMLHIAGKVLAEFGVEMDNYKRWNGPSCLI